MAIGLEDLLRRIDGEQPEMALLLVKAPLGPVVSGLADTYGASPLIEDATIRAAEGELSLDAAGWLAAVEQRDDPWVCVYVALGEVVDLERDLVCQVAADLSDTHSTQAIAFTVHFSSDPEDPSEDGPDFLMADFEAFSEGETTDRVRWRVDGAIEVLETNSKSAPEDTSCVSLDLASRLLADRGIVVAACCPRSRGQQAWLALWDLDPSRIRRVDLFRLRGSSFFEDETLTMDVPDIEADAEEEADASAGDGATTADPPVATSEDNESSGTNASAGGWRGFLQRIFPGRA